MMRKRARARVRPFIAYDLETSNIKAGTPEVRYLTAYGEDGDYVLSVPVKRKDRLEHLCEILVEEFLTARFNGYRFVAWNGNGYDVFFIALAILRDPRFVIIPYLTRGHTVRGMKVINTKTAETWEFLDGMAMTGLDSAKMKLSVFIEKMAPQYPKLELDFSTTEFDAKNKQHVAYAERDSEALYYAMLRANEIMHGLTGCDLQPTMGNLAIKYFQSMMPEGVRCWKPTGDLARVLHGPAKRGGYCWIARQYEGPVWKYDLNQAYAAAMRDAELPCGSSVKTDTYNPDRPGVYRVTFSREKKTLVPFYFRDAETNVGKFTTGREASSWILSTEIEHLLADDWSLQIHEGYYWQQTFNMREMVDTLERLRFTDADGPSGALGTMVKITGNSAFGKTLEVLDGMEVIMSGAHPGQGYSVLSEAKEHANIYWRQGDAFPRVYHQPQIGCFITAHVRIIVRNAARRSPGHFLYADTDCVVFSKPVDYLDIDPRRYGAWKLESAGVKYLFIAKKVYHGEDATQHAKGLRVRELQKDDFEKWFAGVPPEQKQTQRQNFLRVIAGQDMFVDRERKGTDPTKSKQVSLIGGVFEPV